MTEFNEGNFHLVLLNLPRKYVDVSKSVRFSALIPLNPDISEIMHSLACLLIPQEILPQSGETTGTPLHSVVSCETPGKYKPGLRDLCEDL
jgi:hypothetical protein